jgi:type I restriction enzyme, S subunit
MLPKTCYERHQFSHYFKTNLPDHWSEKRLGFLAAEEKAAFVDGPFGSDLKSSDYIDEGVPLIQLNNIRDSKHLMQNMKFVSEEKKQELFRHIAIPGDIVIAKMADPVARAAIVNEAYQEYVIVADCVKFTPNLKLINLRYLVWAINCDYVRINAELVSTGTTRVRINLGELKKLKIPYPTEPEQIAIANFLDHETAKIDTLIEKQQQLIQLLKEKRQAVISHAVTKGLNPNAPMKDSGVEWLGEVPEHWDVCRLGDYALKIGSGKTPKGGSEIYQDEGVLFLRSQNIYDDGLRIGQAESVYIDEYIDIEMSSTRVCAGDILLNITGGSIGRTCIVPEPFQPANVNQHVCIVRMPKVLRAFISFFMKSTSLKEQIDFLQNGGNREGLNFEQIRKFSVVLPPQTELEEICEYINQQLDKFDEMMSQSEQAIQLMQERRTALISAAVTGKIDVRNWQAPEAKAQAVV